MQRTHVESIVWSKEAFTPGEFIKNFKEEDYPLIALVTAGYLGDSDVETFSQDEVICITGKGSQRRAVARDQSGRSLSIPFDYPIEFQVKVLNGFSSPRPLAEVLKNCSMPVTVRFDQSFAEDFYVNSESIKKEHFEELKIDFVYEEEYLRGSAIVSSEHDYSYTLIVPNYIKIFMSVARGYKKGGEAWETRKKYCVDLAKQVTDEGNPNITKMAGGSNILMFKGEKKEEGIYEDLESDTYITLRHDFVNKLKAETSSYQARAPPTYENAPDPHVKKYRVFENSPPIDQQYRTGARLPPTVFVAPSTASSPVPPLGPKPTQHSPSSRFPPSPPVLPPKPIRYRQNNTLDRAQEQSGALQNKPRLPPKPTL